MRIDATIVDRVSVGVDTPEDLERARAILAGATSGPPNRGR
jgi:3-deoxy-manno-octulosonate cytidylyltransferase (CMP-KDO synthetase)